MCGIIGYIGEKEAAEILIEGLKKLEYRGYDSAGIAISDAGSVAVKKAKGRLADLEKKLSETGTPKGSIGIGHTRWATHGEPSDRNSHPHTSGKVTLVHNGIIENYMNLKQTLQEDGRTFISETDTEVAAQLIDYYYKGDPFEAIFDAMGRIKGSYALAILFDDIPDKIYAVRKDSPLVIGVGKGENFIASDIPAILSRTREYYLIDEQELAVLTRDDIKIFGFDGRQIHKEIMTATWDIEAAEKGGYPHFMIKEIHEQPRSLRDTIMPRISGGIDNILKAEIPDTSFIKRIIVVACGSAMHAGLLGKYAIEKLARVPVDVTIASEFRYCNPILGEGDLVLIISQSGETADSLAALRLAKQRGVPVYAVVNVVGSSIAREADKSIFTWAGPEIAVATTKAYTAQVAVLYVLALRLAMDRKTVTAAEAETLAAALAGLPDKVAEILGNVEEYQHLASFNQNIHDLFFIGRGQDYALCCEGSLKLKEISYMHSEAYAAGELKHGTISLIDTGVPVVAVATEDALMEKTISNIKEVKARGAFVIFVCKKGAVGNDVFYDQLIEIPVTRGALHAYFNRRSAPNLCLLHLHRQGLRCGQTEKPGQVRHRGISGRKGQQHSIFAARFN
jgi:glutamine---fructose-6-phosphate transaminase (isomerizing)